MVGELDFEKPLVELEERVKELTQFAQEKGIDLSGEIQTLQNKAHALRREIFENLTPWQRISIARHPKRPSPLELIAKVFDGFFELHGDRLFREDPAMVGGIALLDGLPVTVIAPQKGRDTKENIRRNFGLPHPEGYRKAQRLMEQAEKFKRPIVTLVDVVGAYPGIAAEERGQGVAIAESILGMGRLRTPIVVIIIGEGGSGGALAVGVGDRILMLEHAYYSVISPESASIILYKDASRAQDAAQALKITSQDLKRLGVIDEIVPEPLGGAHRDPVQMARILREALIRNLNPLLNVAGEELVRTRYDKFRRMGAVAVEEGNN